MTSTEVSLEQKKYIAKEGKYLIFHLNKEEYGVEILKVQEIIGMMNVTAVPNMPEFIKGIINLRGKIIPVVDLRLKFNMDEKPYTEITCIIIIQVKQGENTKTLGIIVDEVSEVEDIMDSKIESTPNFGNNVTTDYIMGIGKVRERVVMLLNIDKVFTQQETESISKAVN